MNDAGIAQLGRLYARCIAEVIETTAGISLDIREGVSEHTDTAIVAVAGLQGTHSGVLSLKTDAGSLRILTSYMTGVSEEDISEDDLTDCIHELTNMTIGLVKIKSMEESYKHKMVAPFVITGENVRYLQKSDAMYYVCRLESGEMFIELRISF